MFVVTLFLSIFTYFVFEAPYRSLYRYYFESPRILSLLSPMLQMNGSSGDKNRPNINLPASGSINGDNNNNNVANGIRITANGGNRANGKSSNSQKRLHSRELNPNFLFSPHYNLVTNVSSRAESETNSLSNFTMESNTNYSQNPNPDNGNNTNPNGSSVLTTNSCDSLESNQTRIANDDPNNNTVDSNASVEAPPVVLIDR